MTMGADHVDRYLRQLTGLNRRSPHTLAQYRSVCSRFLERCNGESPPAADRVYDFVGAYPAQASRAWAFTIVRGLFSANQWAWPLPAGAYPKIEEQRQVQLDPVHVEKLVGAARGGLGREAAFYLALSTTFGLRRTELARVTKANFERGGIFRLKTAKGGAERVHQLPEAIRPYLRVAPEAPRGDSTMTTMFTRICDEAGVGAPAHAGWHAIRRSLISHLAMRCPEVALVRFMGWRGGTSARILYTYARPPAEDVDRVVFAHHPFVPLWEAPDAN